jgi:Icc protein
VTDSTRLAGAGRPTFRILQVSDCHLPENPQTPYRGHNADDNLGRLAGAVRAFGPDALVLTGDLSEDGSQASYRRMAGWAASFGVPVWWLPGNHDEPERMRPVFESAGFSAGPSVAAGSWTLVLLDSRWPDDPAGELDAERLEPLKTLPAGGPVGVFVHHQPIPVGARWIDRVGMRETARLWEQVAGRTPPRFIAFGHVHQRFRQSVDGVEVLACPSTAANSHPRTERFSPGETTPMARWFVLGKQGFRSGLLAA